MSRPSEAGERPGPSPPANAPILLVISEVDPVATSVAARWGTLPTTEWNVDDVPVRELAPDRYVLRRPGRHIHDERLDLRLPEGLRRRQPTLVFPSIHRSSQNIRALTVHPLGNPGPSAEVGGRPRTLVPTDPPLMGALLRELHERASGAGTVVTYESTHHGPELGLPALFAEIGFGELPSPPAEEVAILEETLRTCERASGSRVAVGLGGGHYAPHFTDLAIKRSWVFGHLLSKHALAEAERATVAAALEGSPGAGGFLYSRAADQELENVRGLGSRLRDGDAPLR